MKILVPTDFSANSKGAIRFAQTLAKQSKNIEVIFFYSVHFMQPTFWNDELFTQYQREETSRLYIELEKFVTSILGKDIKKFLDYKFVVESGNLIGNDIVYYAEKRKVDLICIATQGAGMLRKIIGTHTSYIVKNSHIPVLAVPSRYRAKPISKITFLSDFENIKNELEKVTEFSNSIKSSLEVLHFVSVLFDKEKLERNTALLQKKEYKKITLNLVHSDYEKSLVERIFQYVRKSKPELLVMFAKKEKSIFERIFLPSKSAELTYSTKVPVLIYPK